MTDFRSGRRKQTRRYQPEQQHSERNTWRNDWRIQVWTVLLLGHVLLSTTAVGGAVLSGHSSTSPPAVTRVSYQLELEGTLIVSDGGSTARYPLQGTSDFRFLQHATTGVSGASEQMRAARQFALARTETLVGRDHRIQTGLPNQTSLIHVYEDHQQLLQLSPGVRLTRPQVDLLQFPCDPLPVAALLQGQSSLQAGQRWKVPERLLPLLTGLDFCSEHSGECVVRKIVAGVAEIEFQISCDGGITGSASEVKVQGTLQYVPDSRFVSALQAELREKRSSGVISPGLDVTARIRWSAVEQPEAGSPALPVAAIPAVGRQLLTLQTPWDLALLVSRDWHVYREESELMILRRLESGALAGQLNLKRVPSVDAGQEPDDQEFLDDVSEQVASRGGVVSASRRMKTAAGWSIQRVEAEISVKSTLADATVSGTGSDPGPVDRVLLSYCLCTAPSGQQYSLVFSHLSRDGAPFESLIDSILQTLVLR